MEDTKVFVEGDVIQDVLSNHDDLYRFMHLPSITSYSFIRSILGTKTLISDVTSFFGDVRRANELKIVFNAENAFCDKDLNIGIPVWYTEYENIRTRIQLDFTELEAAKVSFALVNGSSVHEALHVAHSDFLFSEAYTVFKENCTKGTSATGIWDYIVNIAEDLKNESLVQDNWNFYRFILLKNRLFFNSNIFEAVIKKSKGDSIKSRLFELLVLYKNPFRRSEIEAFAIETGQTAIINMLNTICTNFDRADWCSIVANLYEYFADDNDLRNKQYNGSENGRISGVATVVSNTEKELMKVSMVAEKRYGGDPAIPLASTSVSSGKIEPVHVVDVADERFHTKDASSICINSELNFDFMQRLRTSRQVVPTRSETKVRGSRIDGVSLSRIATDGKIFTTKSNEVARLIKDLPEYVVLVDCSGSMYSIFPMVISVLRKMAVAMTRAGIKVTFIGHTSYDNPKGNDDQPVVFNIFSTVYGIQGDIDNRFDMALKLRLKENLDGYAITYASTLFSKGSRKELIVLSDGSPQSPNYADGTQHTKEAIRSVRQKGIRVTSLSLTSAVVYFNNEIYGSDFNVDCTTQQSLESGLQKILLAH